MKKFVKFNLIEEVRTYFKITPYLPIIPWIEKNVVLADDVSSERDKPDFDAYRYQVDILKTWENIASRRRVIVVAVEQIGKSTTWIYGLLYSMIFKPCQSMVVYPSDLKAQETNQVKLKPLMRHIPGLREELAKPRSFRADRYRFSNLVSYFQRKWSEDHL